MTSSPPSDDAPVFRGNTLTPESPRPVHVPEPTNIPVLENQIDPIFNLMSTHLSAAPASTLVSAMESAAAAQPLQAEAPLETARVTDVQTAPLQVAEEKIQEQVEDTTEPESKLPQQDQSEILQTGAFADPSAAPTIDPAGAASEPTTQPGVTLAAPEPLDPTQHSTAIESQPQSFNTGNPTGESSAEALEDGPVNYQALIDNIVPSVPAEAPSESDPAAGPPPSDVSENAAHSSSTLSSPSHAHSSAGLPPRPPPQEKPAIHPNYNPDEDIRSYHYPNLAQPSPITPQNGTFPNAQPFPTSGPAPGTSGLPVAPPPGTSFPAFTRSSDRSDRDSYQSQRGGGRQSEAARRRNQGDREDNTPWGPDIQTKYDQFLADEAVYTAEGTWDRFPKDSRLFVGNLPSELVTKRDIFHIFYRYGRLAQISIKNAYGFVQFMDESACRNAMHSEQGKKIKDKSMHLEISKPPKNARNAAVSAAGERLRASHYRRSRSRSPEPDRRPGSRGERFRGSNDFRDQFRRGRDDYRPGRSPSPPRARAGLDSYRARDRSPDRYGRRDRSRSPYGRYRNRSPSPRRMYNEDDGVPLPRRNPRDVPEVQIVVMDQLDRGFVDFVQNAFRASSLSAAVLAMPGQVSLDAVVKRQIVEGVMAVVKLFRESLMTGKISVQIFDRSGGLNSVRFDEYRDLEPRIAASLVVQSKHKQATAALNAQPQQYGAALQQLGINLPPQPTQQQNPGQPNLASLITQLDGPALQHLLGAMQQQPTTPGSAHSLPQQSPTQTTGYGNMMGGQPPHAPGPNYGYPPPQAASHPSYSGYPSQGQPQQPQQPHQPQQQPGPYNYPQNGPPPNPSQVQEIMSQLAQWRR